MYPRVQEARLGRKPVVGMRGFLLGLLCISGLYPFTASQSPQYNYVNLARNYAEAKSYCRETFSDLATIHNSEDMASLREAVPAVVNLVYIGLKRGEVWQWHWTDGEGEPVFFNWQTGEPRPENDRDSCVAMAPNGKWLEDDCEKRRSFVCFDGEDNRARLIFIAEALSWRDSQDRCRRTFTELVSVRSLERNGLVQTVSRSQTVWIGLFKDSWRWSDGSGSSFRDWLPRQPNNLRNRQDCVTAEFSNNREGRWNDRWCNIRRRFICQGAQKAGPGLTIVTTTKGTEQRDNLILIKENMTWTQALGYCREHHLDLVSVTDALIHRLVAEKAGNASTPHVWLGLRFSCSFHFWFWITSHPGCYHNWAPGQGLGGQQDCGTVGAIEATGGQQWVSLPETEKLNFICYTCSE